MGKENRLTTPRGRVSFPSLDKPRAAPGSTKESFSVTLIFDQAAQKTPSFSALLTEADRVASEKFGAATVAALKKAGKWNAALHRGEEKVTSNGEPMAAYEPGTVYLAASTLYAPDLFDATGTKIPASTVYAGCYARARVVPFAWDNVGGKGVSFGLRGVQFLEDGEKLGGGGMSASEFDAVPGAQPAGNFPGEPAGAEIADADLPF